MANRAKKDVPPTSLQTLHPMLNTPFSSLDASHGCRERQCGSCNAAYRFKPSLLACAALLPNCSCEFLRRTAMSKLGPKLLRTVIRLLMLLLLLLPMLLLLPLRLLLLLLPMLLLLLPLPHCPYRPPCS